jgi:molybdopterin/thiamine biosynthesis adenylyltransferase
VQPLLRARAPATELAHSYAEAGALGMVPGILGSIEAVELIKLILGDLPRVQRLTVGCACWLVIAGVWRLGG